MNSDVLDRFGREEKIPPSLRSDILACGTEAIPRLIEILEAEDDGEGWAPIHAVDLLIDLKATEAIEPMLRALRDSSFNDIIYNKVAVRLPELGAAVVEPCLAMLSDPLAVDTFNAATEILAKCGVRDVRIFDAICAVFDEDPILGAVFFADYGDPHGRDLIFDEIESFDPDEHGLALSDLRELLFAFEELGGVLPDDVAADVRELEEGLTPTDGPEVQRATPKVGRNDPCPCGSGRKYKKCHLG